MSMGIRRWFVPTLVSLALMVAVTPAWAQSNQQNVSNQDSGIGVGVLAGIVRPTLKSDVEGFDEFFSTRTGTMFGLWVGGNKNGLIGFTGEFIYLFRKTDINGDLEGGELKFPAIEIPAVFHINFGSSDRNKAMGYAIVGPVFTINLKQKLDDVDISDEFEGADIGIMAGGGFEVVRIGVEVRGNWGLRNITDQGDVGKIKTRSIEFLVKFRFN